MTLFTISLTVFLAYIFTSILLFGVPISLSQTYYLFERRKKGLGAMFTSFMWMTGFPLLIIWIDVLQNDWDFLPFVAVASLMFVGTATAYRVTMTREVHLLSALLSALSSVLWSVLYGSIGHLIVIILLTLIIVMYNNKNRVFWLEMGAFTNIYIQIFILL